MFSRHSAKTFHGLRSGSMHNVSGHDSAGTLLVSLELLGAQRSKGMQFLSVILLFGLGWRTPWEVFHSEALHLL